MSNPGVDQDRPDPRARFGDLEKAVERYIRYARTVEAELTVVRNELDELKGMFQRFASGEEAPSEALGRVKHLEAENEQLIARIDRARAKVDGLVEKIRFLEEHA